MSTPTPVKIGSTPFTVRSGEFGPDLCPFAASGVSAPAKGQVCLTLTKANGEWRSAGVIGPVIEPDRTYVFETHGRYDQMDPGAVFAAWGRNDVNKNEVDFLEATRWRDQNQPNLYTGGWFFSGSKTEPSVGYPARSYTRHKFVVTTTGTSISTVIYGYWEMSKDWKMVASFGAPFFEGMLMKFAIWLPTVGPVYTDAADMGRLSVTVSDFAVTTPSAATAK